MDWIFVCFPYTNIFVIHDIIKRVYENANTNIIWHLAQKEIKNPKRIVTTIPSLWISLNLLNWLVRFLLIKVIKSETREIERSRNAI